MEDFLVHDVKRRQRQHFHIAEALRAAPKVQYGALPWRMVDGTLEVLLLTSRDTGRWVLPKGWPHEGMSPAKSAAQEAFEEAGITGAITRKDIGRFHYLKFRPDKRSVECVVHVHALEVEKQLDDWPERLQRKTQWFLRHEAAERVDEPELRDIILSFVP
ncbi:NUDIX hydrolase [Oricola sp.]|uniref:NUDIX hydrolase n=1 Tax=Oricola sp. TaxID=1979950 RepID=UPI003BA8CE06